MTERASRLLDFIYHRAARTVQRAYGSVLRSKRWDAEKLMARLWERQVLIRVNQHPYLVVGGPKRPGFRVIGWLEAWGYTPGASHQEKRLAMASFLDDLRDLHGQRLVIPEALVPRLGENGWGDAAFPILKRCQERVTQAVACRLRLYVDADRASPFWKMLSGEQATAPPSWESRRLREARLRARFMIRDLARHLGVTHQAVSEWERIRVPKGRIAALREILGDFLAPVVVAGEPTSGPQSPSPPVPAPAEAPASAPPASAPASSPKTPQPSPAMASPASPAPAPAPARAAARHLGQLLFGTCGWLAPRWEGPFYPPRLPHEAHLFFYARHFPSVEWDSTFHKIPSPWRVTERLRERTPDRFVFSVRFPRSIVYGGSTPWANPETMLRREAVACDLDGFLAAVSRLGQKCGPLLLPLPFFRDALFRDPRPLFERLERFLGALPRTFRYAVEVRNRTWIAEPLLALLKRHRTALALVDVPTMPHPSDIMASLDPLTTDFAYFRLLGSRGRTDPARAGAHGRTADGRARDLSRTAALVAYLLRRVPKVFVYANDDYGGFAPDTIETLVETVEKVYPRYPLRDRLLARWDVRSPAPPAMPSPSAPGTSIGTPATATPARTAVPETIGVG